MDEPIYISTADAFTPFPESIIQDMAHKFLDSFLKEREDKYMDKFHYTDMFGNDHTYAFGEECKKLAIAHDSYRESEYEFRSRANYIANVFDADIEFRKDFNGICKDHLVAYLTFAMKFMESDEQFDNRVHYATKAFSTFMPQLHSPIQGRYLWNGWESNFDIYQGINNKTGKLQTIVKWDDGEKTIVNCGKYELPLIYPVAYAYCIRRFGSNSAFKKSVETTRIGDYIYGSMSSCGRYFTASVPAKSKKIDIYDEMAIMIASERYMGIAKFEEFCMGRFHRNKNDDAMERKAQIVANERLKNASDSIRSAAEGIAKLNSVLNEVRANNVRNAIKEDE